MKRYGWFLVFVLGLLGCVRELPEISAPDPVEEDEPRVTVKITIPAVTASPLTKSLGEEIELNNLYLAVFGSSGYLKEYIKASPTVDDDGRIIYEYVQDPYDSDPNAKVRSFSYTASLTLSESPRTIHFIGNGPSTLPFGSADEVLPTLMSVLRPTSADEQIQAFWQMVELPYGITAKRGVGKDDDGNEVEGYVTAENESLIVTSQRLRSGAFHYKVAEETEAQFQNIQLVRNWSKVTVTSIGKNDPEGREFSNFEVKSFALYNAPSRGTIVPYNTKTGSFMKDYQKKDFEALQEAGYPANLPGGTSFTTPDYIKENFELDDNGDFKVPFTGEGGSVVKAGEAVYIYERPAPSDQVPPSFVIVYGFFTDPDYPGDTPDNIAPGSNSGYCFYKIDFYEKGTYEDPVTHDQVTVSRYYPVYRNFQYDIEIAKILSRGQDTPEAAVASAGNADVSADVSTTGLLDISDGVARLIVSPWLSHTFVEPVRTDEGSYQDFANGILKVKFLAPGENKVDVDVRQMSGSSSNLITKCEFLKVKDDNGQWVDYVDNDGWRTIVFETEKPQAAHTKSQIIRITGTYYEGQIEKTLYRDVVITVQQKQDLIVSVEGSDWANQIGQNRDLADFDRGTDKSQVICVDIPDGLVASMFPLEFIIEPEDMTLTPDTQQNIDLPVTYGESISQHTGYISKQVFHYVRALTYDQYLALERWTDHLSTPELTWRRFKCYFKTTKEENATTVWVKQENKDVDGKISEYFNYNEYSHAAFTNPLPNRFTNFGITKYIPQGEGVDIPVHFEVVNNPSLPVVKVTVTGMKLSDEAFDALGEGATLDRPSTDTYVYTYQTVRRSQDLVFQTTDSNYGKKGLVTCKVEADESYHYVSNATRSHVFSHVGFIDGHNIPSNAYLNGGVSNVVCGYCPIDNKNVLFGYCDDSDENGPYAKVTFAGLTNLTPQKISLPWQPTTKDGEPSYHLVHFKTSGAGDVRFRLRAPGYVESDPIVAGRMTSGDIGNWDAKTVSFTYSDFKTTATSKTKSNYKVSFDRISSISEGSIILETSEAPYTLTVEGTADATRNKIYYVEITVENNSGVITGIIQDSNKWDISTVTMTDALGNSWNVPNQQVRPYMTSSFERYAPASNEYVWFIPIPNTDSNRSIQLKATDGPIKITKIVPKSYAGGLSDPSTP